jgi:hypothetical protein
MRPEASCHVDGGGGNREVPPVVVRGASAAASFREEGGSWERYASEDDTAEPKAEEVA